MESYYNDRDVTFEIIEEIGIISTAETGWTKELNLVRWNGSVAKYDIREWDPPHDRMSRGITLKEEEMRRILELMKRRRSSARNRRKPGPVQVETSETDIPAAEDSCDMVDIAEEDEE